MYNPNNRGLLLHCSSGHNCSRMAGRYDQCQLCQFQSIEGGKPPRNSFPEFECSEVLLK